jgi:uncharacterized protein (TIGR04255 family)
MEFKDHPRVIYAKNPITEVLFQIRMPRLLAIEQQLPVQFQESLKDKFPILEARTEQEVIISPQGKGVTQTQHPTVYDFRSIDRHWCVSLSSQFFALVNNKYERWEHFRDASENVISAMLKTYDPVLFSRVGLRYKSVISRESLGLDSVPWKELISNGACGFFDQLGSYEQEKDELLMYQSQVQFLIDPGKANLRTSLVKNPNTNEIGFLIDGDYFTDEEKETDLNAAVEALGQLHKYAYKVFRWCIKPKLHDAMEPSPAE